MSLGVGELVDFVLNNLLAIYFLNVIENTTSNKIKDNRIGSPIDSIKSLTNFVFIPFICFYFSESFFFLFLRFCIINLTLSASLVLAFSSVLVTPKS